MNSNAQQRKVILIIGAFLVALLVVTFSLLSRPSERDRDAASQEPTTTNQQVATQYIGFNALLERGFSSNQLADLRYALYTYANQSNKQFGTVEATDVNHLHDREKTEWADQMLFNVKFDGGEVYRAHVDYSAGFAPIRLYLYKGESKTPVYDSGVVNLNATKDPSGSDSELGD